MKLRGNYIDYVWGLLEGMDLVVNIHFAAIGGFHGFEQKIVRV